MARNFYALRFEDGYKAIYQSEEEYKRAVKIHGKHILKGFYSYYDADLWLKNPEAIPQKRCFYAVKAGYRPGVYQNVEDYNAQVKGYVGALGKAFYTEKAAQLWIAGKDFPSPASYRQRLISFLRDTFSSIFAIFTRKRQFWEQISDIRADSQPWIYCRIKTKHPLIIYTDASCRPGKGAGYAAVIIDTVSHAEFYVGGSTENIKDSNRAELYAILMALQMIDPVSKASIEIRTDAQSLVSFAKMKNLRKLHEKKWLNNTIKNADLWEKFYGYACQRLIMMSWVRGHSKDKYNVKCDKIAGKLSKNC